MCGHIGKPIDPAELARLVASFRPTVASARNGTAEPDSAAAFADIDGLDARDGVRRTRGRVELYESLLRQFAEGFRGFGDDARRLLAAGSRDEAAARAHSLKGVAANLGAARVASCAAQLEAVLRGGEPHEPVLERLDAALLPLLGTIGIRIGLTDRAKSIEAAGTVLDVPLLLPDWVHELRRMLADGDVAAQRLWKQRGDELSSTLPAHRYMKLRRAIDNFEFDVALDALGAALPAT
jgi:HPt (histidine-containing phosphotransfer) domain-containing protein